MKKFICGILVFALLAGGVLGCAKEETVPARGVWDGRTYTNTEAGIRLTVPEEYHIDTDQELIEWGEYSDNYFDDVKSKDDYFDLHIKDETSESVSRMYIEYFSSQINRTTEQYINYFEANNRTITYNGETLNKTYGDAVEKMICGQTFICCSSTVDGVDGFFGMFCYRVISGNTVIYIDVRGGSEAAVDAYLAFFDTTSVE